MSVTTIPNRIAYTGDGTTTTFSFPYYFALQSDLVVYYFDTVTNVITQKILGTDYTVTGAVNAQGLYSSGGSVVCVTAPAATVKVVIDRSPSFLQQYALGKFGVISSVALVQQLDFLTLYTQKLQDRLTRSTRLPDGYAGAFDPALPAGMTVANAGRTLAINDTGTGFKLGIPLTPTSLIPTGGNAGSVLEKKTSADQDVEWKDYSYSGFSARFGSGFTSTSLDDTLKQILNLTYAAPLVSLAASGSGTIYEKGFAITATTLTATITKRSDPITAVRYYKGATLVNTSATPPAAGGTDNYNWSGSFADNTTFNVQVDDSGVSNGNVPSTVSSSVSFSYVYPYYVGAGTSSLTPAQVAALTKRVIASTVSRTETITATAGQVFYFAYPQSYGVLTSILDVNNFETLADWTRTTISITGLDATSQSYYQYKFNNPVTAGSYQYTFKR